MHLKRRQTCRICGSSALTAAIDLGSQFMQGSFVKPGFPSPPARRIPTALVRCDPLRDENACGLLQMETTVPPDVLYSTYWYRSGTSHTMRTHLRNVAVDAERRIGDTKGRIALDIGCNDGTLLGFFSSGMERIGIDPSNIADPGDSGATVLRDFFPSAKLTAMLGARKCSIVTSIAMLYDLEDPLAFCRQIRDVLADDGLWIFEVSYLGLMLTRNLYDSICHEHIEYYSLAVLETMLDRCGLKVCDAELNDVNGGSIRCYVTHKASFAHHVPEAEARLRELRLYEFAMELETPEPYREFQARANRHRDELMSLLKGLIRAGNKIHLYGASTKGNTLLQWCGIDGHLIEYAAERNPEKWGARTLGTDIAIVSEAQSRELRPDYYLVLPWHFRDEIVVRERETIAAGTGLIFPLPTIDIVREAALQPHLGNPRDAAPRTRKAELL